MTDIQQFIIMISKSRETFEKRKDDHGWQIIITGRGIVFYFNKDESFNFCSKIIG